jgi:arabinoxylan arabinofuranohydrolase
MNPLLNLCAFVQLSAAALASAPAGFLFLTFKGEQTPMSEQIHFALSRDGRTWTGLNRDEPVLVSEVGEKGVRDPYLLRSKDGGKFFIVATDLSINRNGDWGRAVRAGSKSLLIWESTDLVDWEGPRLVKVAPDDAGCSWAPEAVYDEESGGYLVFWASTTGRDNFEKHRIWGARTKDFRTFGEPFIFIEKPTTVIDTTIVHDGKRYHRFTKDEKHKAITLEHADRLSGPWEEQPAFTLAKLVGYEGPQCYLIEPAAEGRPPVWGLILDHYARGEGYQPFTTNDLNSGNFVPAQGFKFPYKFRHGSVLPVTEEEFQRLQRKWGAHPAESLQVTAPVRNNPVIPGYFADPDILWSAKTGRYYIYPTSDGFTDWSGTYFKTFSSADLVNWTDEGVILDLPKDVSWAKRNAWAPCIIETRTAEGYRYHYYFTAAQKIGVAVANHPAGPFRDSGRALIDFKPEGVTIGQEIDPEVFHDPVSGKHYLYWGNGYLAVAELTDDLLSIRRETLKVITPDPTFREGATVFIRNGTYYILWSEDDTRSENYRVRYATAPTPTGPLTIPPDNLVIAKDPSLGIYGTGHNTILQIPGRDEWYIVYHRFNYPKGITMGRDAGYHRELCIDRMHFEPDGRIRRVQPTHEGVGPVPAPAAVP